MKTDAAELDFTEMFQHPLRFENTVKVFSCVALGLIHF